MSNQEAMQQLADRFMNDADFREQMRQDPEGAAERSGLQLDEEDKPCAPRRLPLAEPMVVPFSAGAL